MLRFLSNRFAQILLYLLSLLAFCFTGLCTVVLLGIVRENTQVQLLLARGEGFSARSLEALRRFLGNPGALIAPLAASALVGLALLALLLFGVGREKDGSVRSRFGFVFPFDVSLVLGGIGVSFFYFTAHIASAFVYSDIPLLHNAAAVLYFAVLSTAVLLALIAELATQLRCRVLLKSLLVVRVFCAAGKLLRLALGYLSVSWLFVLVYAAFLFSNVYLLMLCVVRSSNLAFFTLLALDIAALFLFLAFASQLRTLQRAAQILASGELGYQVSVERLWGQARRHGEALNAIREGMQRAVDARMKNERFRTELITNVSHDLKTPLTSIVNFTDLLSREDLPEGKAREYVEVLMRQAGKLRKLTEDLIEASKASSGVIPVHLENLQVRELVMQAAAEYAERMEKAGLTPVYRLGEALVIRADGRLLWRVFDNLLSNICKYALPGTRVYIEAQEEDGIVRICFKNVSAQMLGIDAQELTERFVRGDSSRSTQGSGLGLSIAQSLTALQGGRFSLSIDGDLFTAAVEFARAPENA